MSQSDKGNPQGRNQAGRPSKPRPQGGRGDEGAQKRQQNWREHLPEDARAADGRRGGGRGKGRDDGRRPDNRRPAAPPAPALEYLLVQQSASLVAEIGNSPAPLIWSSIPDNAFLKPGLYLRYKGSLQAVARDMVFDNAVLFVLWDDEQLAYRTREGWERPGLRAGFLIPTSYPESEGPPWIPLDAAIPDSIYEWDKGLLSSHLDPSHCTMFKARLTSSPGALQVSAEAVHEDSREKADKALLDTIAWLARHPESDHPGAVAARTMLIEQGHGLQRAGVITMSHGDDVSSSMLRDVLAVLAPDVAPVLQAVYALWSAEEGAQEEPFMELARVLRPLNDPRSPLQNPRQLAVLATWLIGIFGARADRERRRPARSLFAALRMLRKTRGDVDALRHPDVELPNFPASRALTDELIADLSWLPNEETDLERLVRALAVGESSRDFARPTLAHIRPFAQSFYLTRPWPVATRTLLGRYDGITTMWSFRGRELDERGGDIRALASGLILQTSTWASSRAYGRIIGFQGALAEPLSQALALKPDRGPEHSPELVKIAELHGLSLEDAVERLAKATRARRPNADRVVEAISTHEYLVSRLSTEPTAIPDWTPIEPEWTGGEDTAVRRHFMYWRTWCRSVIPRAQETYGAFIQRVLPHLGELPWKLENEALALIRNWANRADKAEVEAILPALEARLEAIVEDAGATRDERLLAILTVLASCSFEKWEEGVRRILDHPGFDYAEWNRILELPRQNDAGEALLASSVFRELHAALSKGDSAGVAAGRVEWVRQATLRGRRGQRVRWLLQRDAWPEIVFSESFIRWFQEQGLTLLEEGDAPVSELLKLALVSMAPDSVDIPAYHLALSAELSPEAIAELLLNADRSLSAAALLTVTPSADLTLNQRALDGGLEHAKGIEDLALLARLVAAARAQGLTLDRHALAERIEAHQIPRGDRLTLVRLLEAWRLADVALASENGSSAIRSAVFCLADTHDQECRRFVSWAVERALVDEIRDDLVAALRTPASAELYFGSLADFEWSQTLGTLFRAMRELPRRSPQHAAVMSAIHAGEEIALLEALVDGELLERAARDLDATRASISALREQVHAALQENASAPEEDDTSASEDSAEDAAAANTEENTEEESASDESSDAASSAGRRRGRPFSEIFAGRARQSQLERLRAALAFWSGTLAEATSEDLAAVSAPLRLALASADLQRLPIREGTLARVVALVAARGLRIDDPKNVVANAILRGAVDANPAVIAAAVERVLELQARHSDAKKVTVTRDALSLTLMLATASAEEETPEKAPFEGGGAGEGEGAVDAAEASAEGSEAAQEDAESAQEDSASEEGVELPLIVRAWRNDAGVEGAREVFGGALNGQLLRRALKRNEELQLTINAKNDRVEIALRWGRPRRQGGRRRG